MLQFTQQKIQARMPNSARNQKFSRKWQALVILKNEQHWNLLLVSTMTSAESKHQTYLCLIFVFAYVPLHMLFKIPKSFLQSVFFFIIGEGI